MNRAVILFNDAVDGAQVLMAAGEGSILAVPVWAIALMFNGGGERQS